MHLEIRFPIGQGARDRYELNGQRIDRLKAVQPCLFTMLANGHALDLGVMDLRHQRQLACARR